MLTITLEAAGFEIESRDILLFDDDVGWMRVTAVPAP